MSRPHAPRRPRRFWTRCRPRRPRRHCPQRPGRPRPLRSHVGTRSLTPVAACTTSRARTGSDPINVSCSGTEPLDYGTHFPDVVASPGSYPDGAPGNNYSVVHLALEAAIQTRYATQCSDGSAPNGDSALTPIDGDEDPYYCGGGDDSFDAAVDVSTQALSAITAEAPLRINVSSPISQLAADARNPPSPWSCATAV